MGNVRGGEYTFTINGQTATRMRGVGMLDMANNTFSGDLRCDPATAYCGANGRPVWCGSDAYCAWFYALYYDGNWYYTVGVAAIPITIVSTIR